MHSISSTFAAYKQYISDGERADHVRGLTFEEARDAKRFPLGLQSDKRGDFVWLFGANDGYQF